MPLDLADPDTLADMEMRAVARGCDPEGDVRLLIARVRELEVERDAAFADRDRFLAEVKAAHLTLDAAGVPDPGIDHLTTRLTLLAEHDRDAYAEGHASGDKDRFARCKQDLARSLGVAEDGGRDWADLLRLVGRTA